jgi:L-ascorbate metabolism protein UlaG (beta-lactamase superfamily)
MTVRIGEEMIKEINKTRVPYGMLAIWFLGQVSVIIKGGDKVIYVDPYLSHSPHRAFEPPIKAEEMTNADYVFITHDHSDHLDPGTISALTAVQGETVYMAPGFSREAMLQLGVHPDKVIQARTDEWWEGPGIKVKPLPSAHEELEYDTVLGHRFVGYVIQLNGVTLYHAGDTTVYPGLIERLKAESIDLGMLPINGRDPFRNAMHIVGNMNYREAAELAVAAGFDTVIPLHYDMFAANSERPGYFIDYIFDRHPTQKSHVMARFERYVYVSGSVFK